MEKPLVTVNIACYNQISNLKVILEALKHQTYTNYEISITDDGSSDGTKEWAGNLEGIRYYWQEDLGFRLAKSKNMGISSANGDYFLSLEADVIPHPKLLSEMMLFAKPNRIIYGVRHEIPSLPTELDFKQMDKSITSMDWRMEALRQIKNIKQPWRLCSGCNVLFPTKALQEAGGWNEDFKTYGVDDYEVCLRMAMRGNEIIAVPGAYGYHITHPLRQTSDENVAILKELESKYESSD